MISGNENPFETLISELSRSAEEHARGTDSRTTFHNWCCHVIERTAACITDPLVLVRAVRDLTKHFTISTPRQPQETSDLKITSDVQLIQSLHSCILDNIVELLSTYMLAKTEWN